MFPQLFDKQKLETPEEMHTEAIVKKVFDGVIKSLYCDLQEVSKSYTRKTWWPATDLMINSWWPADVKLVISLTSAGYY